MEACSFVTADKDLIFVAGGSGMAPIKSLLEEVFSDHLKKKRGSSMVLVRKKTCIYSEEWMELAEKLSKLSLYSGSISAGC